MEIRSIAVDDIPQSMIEQGRREGLLFLDGIEYVGMFDGDRLVGFAGFKAGRGSAVLKAEFVLPDYRGCGIGTRLIEHNLKTLAARGIRRAWANCTPASVGIHMRLGGEPVRTYRNGVTRVRHEILH